MDRSSLAYLIMAGMALAVAVLLSYRIYHSHGRSYRRRIRRENADHAALRENGPPDRG